MSYSPKKEPTGESLNACESIINMHLIHQRAKTKRYFERSKMDYFSHQLSCLPKSVTNTLKILRDDNPKGRVVIFTQYMVFLRCFNGADATGLRGSVGFYAQDKFEPIIFVINPVTGENVKCILDPAVKDHGFQEFGV